MSIVGEVDFHDSATAAPPAAVSVPDLIDALADSDGGREALVAGTTRLTYADLAARSRRVAAGLHGLGVGPNDVVALLAPNRSEWIEAAIGAHRCGARVDAFNTWVKAYDLDYLLRSSGATVLILTDGVRQTDLLAELRALLPEIDRPGPLHSTQFPRLQHVVVIGDEAPPGVLAWETLVRPAVVGSDAVTDERPDRASSPAFVLYTSGSTSTPKAVPLCHRDLVLNGFHIGERMGLGRDDRVWLGSPLFWSYGCANSLMAAFTHGACLVLQEAFSSAGALELMSTERITAAYLLPTMIDALVTDVADEVRALPALRTGLTIGRPDVIDAAAHTLGIVEICNIYGSTETYGNCCVTDHRMSLAQRRSCQGEPLPGVEVRIVDQTTQTELGPDEAGEAQVRGRLTPGYLNDDAANTTAFTADGWFRTGDRMMRHADGTVAFVDRTTDMIKTSGINVSPAEIESFLATHPGVREVLVVGAAHPTKDQVAVAFVVTHDPTLTDADISAFAKGRIAGYKVPWLIVLVDELPRTGTGKLVRRTLVDEASSLVRSALTAQST